MPQYVLCIIYCYKEAVIFCLFILFMVHLMTLSVADCSDTGRMISKS
jgi:hypothetical protein